MGPLGDEGLTGAPGVSGDAGYNGNDGLSGLKGFKGDDCGYCRPGQTHNILLFFFFY